MGVANRLEEEKDNYKVFICQVIKALSFFWEIIFAFCVFDNLKYFIEIDWLSNPFSFVGFL